MKSIALIAAGLLATPLVAQPRVPDRQIALPPLPGFVPGYQQRAGRQTIVEFVPTGQSVKRYDRMVTLNTFPVRPAVSAAAVLDGFARRYAAACPRTTVTPVPLSNGQRGIRLDCPRNPQTGRMETVFARALPMQPEMAIVQYMTTYLAMPKEAGFARDFLGRVSVR